MEEEGRVFFFPNRDAADAEAKTLLTQGQMPMTQTKLLQELMERPSLTSFVLDAIFTGIVAARAHVQLGMVLRPCVLDTCLHKMNPLASQRVGYFWKLARLVAHATIQI